MEKIFISADGGCYGNFLAILLRLAYDSNYIKENPYGLTNFITKTGSADFGSYSSILLAYLREQGVEPWANGETQVVIDEIVKLYNSKSFVQNSNIVHEYDVTHCHISLGHYLKLRSIEKLLSVPDLKIVYVTFEQEDCKLISTNKITKNFDPDNCIGFSAGSTGFKNLLIQYGANEEYLQEFDAYNGFGVISNKLKSKLIELWEITLRQHLLYNLQVRRVIKDDRVLLIRFDEIFKDRDQFLNKLTKFVQKKLNVELIDFYEEFKTAQKMYHT